MTRTSHLSVREGVLPGGLPYLAEGSGPAVVVLPGLEPRNENPRGAARTSELRRWSALAQEFTVHVVRRSPGVPEGCSMADLAAELARALEGEVDGPVGVLGISTGGSVALQLAIDHPQVVRRLVLLASACRLSDEGRWRQRAHAAYLAAGEQRRAQRILAPALTASAPMSRLVGGLLWLAGPVISPEDPTDLLRTIAAEDSFDVTEQLHRVTAPTLVIAGARDGFYSPELFERTAAGIPGAVLRPHPTRGHARTVMSRDARRLAGSFLRAG